MLLCLGPCYRAPPDVAAMRKQTVSAVDVHMSSCRIRSLTFNPSRVLTFDLDLSLALTY